MLVDSLCIRFIRLLQLSGTFRLTICPVFTLNFKNELNALSPLTVLVETEVTLLFIFSVVTVLPSGTICCA